MYDVYSVYLEYHSICPLVGIGTAPPSLASKYCMYPPPPPTQRGARSPAGEGVGSPNLDDWRKNLALCLLCGYKGWWWCF